MAEQAPPVHVAAGEFSADRRRGDGTRSFWATATADGAAKLRRWTLLGDEWREVSTASGRTWLDAAAGDSELLEICADAVTEFTGPEEAAFLDLLRPNGENDPHRVEWRFDVTQYEDFDDSRPDAEGLFRRWATLNGKRISFAECGTEPVWILGDWDEFEGTSLGSFSWDNDWGSGNSEVWEIRPGAAVATSWRDGDGWVMKGFRFEADAEGIAGVESQWTDFLAYHHPPQTVEVAYGGEDDDEQGIEASITFRRSRPGEGLE